ncbi:MAG: acyl-ACP--UDP-N-acetylglucosamine O-acyltransferase [Gammaproteobacteria bacterium]|nr:acyl-ACP--UDP-N-acetylglucosamine O-acyltransferase [Gammaproteobacteria bacterium]
MIDDRAVVSPDARLADDVTIGPFAVIGADVEIGAGTRIDAHAVVNGPTTIGRNNHIFQFASIGDDPQDKKYAGERTSLVIGDGNTIREFVTINRGTVQDRGVTTVGNDNWIMAYCHIAHDCVVGNHTIFANNASIAGHVHVDDYAILGGFTAVHQFCRLGENSLSSMFTYVTKDIPAYTIVAGRPAEPRGINVEGLKRRQFSTEQIRAVREAYRTVYRQGMSLEEAIAAIEARGADDAVRRFVESLRQGSRGLVR